MLYVTAQCRCGWTRTQTAESHERFDTVKVLESAAAVHEDVNVRNAYRHDASVRVEGR